MKGDKRQCAHEIMRRINARQGTQREFARISGLDPATLTRLIHGLRPTEDVLRRVVAAWPARADGIAILCAHLRDEIARAGAQESEIHVAPTRDTADQTLTSIVHELRRYASRDESVRALLEDLAVVLRAADHAAARGLQVAADAPADKKK